MSMTKGYVLHLTPDRMKAFRECREDGRYRFGEPVPNFPHNRYAPLICFLVNEGKIIHITPGNRGRQNRAGSGLSPLKLDRSEPLKTPIPLDQLLENVPKKNKSYLGKRVASGGLLNQAAEYDRKHMTVQGVKHLMLFVSDKASALSTNWKELRNLPKDDPTLVAKARDRWYVPDPNKAGDLEKLREKALLKEFEAYKGVKKKLKVFRLEAVRAGFKKAWQERDYAVIVAVADNIPNNVLEEDPKLLMWYDQAVTRMGGE